MIRYWRSDLNIIRGSLLVTALIGFGLMTPAPARAEAETYSERAVQVARGTLPAEALEDTDQSFSHAGLLTPLLSDTEFPRFTSAQLQSHGYPDHMHAFYWSVWSTAVDHDGRTYGPGSLCDKHEVLPREGLQVIPGHIVYGQFDLTFNSQYGDCDLILFPELLEMARIRCRDLLELERDGTLRIVNPDNSEAYQQLSGYGIHRTYKLMGDSVLVEPIPILTARTLIGHTAVELMTRWTLHGTVGEVLPPWLEHGLANYLADMGGHLVNFMGEFRHQGIEVLLRPSEVDAILSAPPNADPAVDRQQQRIALYSAFLMVWRLVEDNGGLDKMRRFLVGCASGTDPAEMSCKIYGKDLQELAAWLHPVERGDPLGPVVEAPPYGSRRLHQTPGDLYSEQSPSEQPRQHGHDHGHDDGHDHDH